LQQFFLKIGEYQEDEILDKFLIPALPDATKETHDIFNMRQVK